MTATPSTPSSMSHATRSTGSEGGAARRRAIVMQRSQDEIYRNEVQCFEVNVREI